MTARQAALAGLLAALAGQAGAEDRTGALIDALVAPVDDATGLAASLEAQGFGLTGLALTGPGALPPEVADPVYFHLRADVSDLAQPGPLILLECSRIGPGLLPHLPRGATAEGPLSLPVVPVLQWAETVDFLPGAGSQLRCLADILPVTPDLAAVALPDAATVMAAITPRFAAVATEPLNEGAPADWVLYPPLVQPAPVEPLLEGPMVITAGMVAADDPGRALALRYEHRGSGALHSLQIISHRPAEAD